MSGGNSNTPTHSQIMSTLSATATPFPFPSTGTDTSDGFTNRDASTPSPQQDSIAVQAGLSPDTLMYCAPVDGSPGVGLSYATQFNDNTWNPEFTWYCRTSGTMAGIWMPFLPIYNRWYDQYGEYDDGRGGMPHTNHSDFDPDNFGPDLRGPALPAALALGPAPEEAGNEDEGDDTDDELYEQFNLDELGIPDGAMLVPKRLLESEDVNELNIIGFKMEEQILVYHDQPPVPQFRRAQDECDADEIAPTAYNVESYVEMAFDEAERGVQLEEGKSFWDELFWWNEQAEVWAPVRPLISAYLRGRRGSSILNEAYDLEAAHYVLLPPLRPNGEEIKMMVNF